MGSDSQSCLLNGGHAIIAYPAGLMDIQFAHKARENPLIRAFLEKIEREEIIPIVPPVPDTDLEDYYALIARRSSNPKIGDTVRRLCLAENAVDPGHPGNLTALSCMRQVNRFTGAAFQK